MTARVGHAPSALDLVWNSASPRSTSPAFARRTGRCAQQRPPRYLLPDARSAARVLFEQRLRVAKEKVADVIGAYTPHSPNCRATSTAAAPSAGIDAQDQHFAHIWCSRPNGILSLDDTVPSGNRGPRWSSNPSGSGSSLRSVAGPKCSTASAANVPHAKRWIGGRGSARSVYEFTVGEGFPVRILWSRSCARIRCPTACPGSPGRAASRLRRGRPGL